LPVLERITDGLRDRSLGRVNAALREAGFGVERSSTDESWTCPESAGASHPCRASQRQALDELGEHRDINAAIDDHAPLVRRPREGAMAQLWPTMPALEVRASEPIPYWEQALGWNRAKMR
jgi:hypothetical protein